MRVEPLCARSASIDSSSVTGALPGYSSGACSITAWVRSALTICAMSAAWMKWKLASPASSQPAAVPNGFHEHPRNVRRSCVASRRGRAWDTGFKRGEVRPRVEHAPHANLRTEMVPPVSAAASRVRQHRGCWPWRSR